MTKPFDPIALRIGLAYRRGLAAYVEAGKLLADKKASLKHGAWLPWLAKNADALGFDTDRTAQRLIKLAAENPTLASDSPPDPVEAQTITRKLWGHGTNTFAADADLKPEPRTITHSTPEPYWRPVYNLRGRIDQDVFSPDPPTVACRQFFTKEQDGFAQDWAGVVWLQPQYDRESMRRLTEKVPQALVSGRVELMAALLMLRSTPAWTRMLRDTGARIFHFTHGIKFGGMDIKAPFDNQLAVWLATKAELKQLGETLPPNYLIKIVSEKR